MSGREIASSPTARLHLASVFRDARGKRFGADRAGLFGQERTSDKCCNEVAGSEFTITVPVTV